MASGSFVVSASEERLDTVFASPRARERYHDSEIEEVALLLQRCGHPAARCPRTYIVLRTIGELEVLHKLLSEEFGDHWFPVGSARGLPTFLEQRIANNILANQWIIETDALDFEHGKHLNLTTPDAHLFILGDSLGSGNFGQVNKIVSRISFKEYALKRIRRRAAFGNKSKEAIKDFLAEKERMSRLSHPHIVQYIGSYTDQKNFGLVMSPVADCDLATYMRDVCQEAYADKRLTLQSFFGCLAAALFYLHGRSIKHKDIKPANVLIHRSNVLITDFGISHDFLDTTSGVTVHTPRYSAPEVAQGGKRNESADIWSLGCVFMEMAAALHGFDIDWVRNYFAERYTHNDMYHGNPKAVESLLGAWDETWTPSEKTVLPWIQTMLAPQRQDRPKAAQVLEMITSDTSAMAFCGICCVADDLSGSEIFFSDEDDVVRQISRRESNRDPSHRSKGLTRNIRRGLISRGGSSAALYLLASVTAGIIAYYSYGHFIVSTSSQQLSLDTNTPRLFSESSQTSISDTLHYAISLPTSESEREDSEQSFSIQDEIRQDIETNSQESAVKSTQKTGKTPSATQSSEVIEATSQRPGENDPALDLLWNLTLTPLSRLWKFLYSGAARAVGFNLSFEDLFLLALIQAGYTLANNILDKHLLGTQEILHMVEYMVESMVPGLGAALYYLYRPLEVLLMVDVFLVAVFFGERRVIQGVFRGLVLPLQFWCTKWVIGSLVSLIPGLHRQGFDDWFGFVVSTTLLFPFMRLMLKAKNAAMAREWLRDVMDAVTGIFCWSWILSWKSVRLLYWVATSWSDIVVLD